MMKIASRLLPAAIVALSASAALGQDGEYRYENRGSVVTVIRDRNRLFIAYLEPSAQRLAEGAAAGSELFTGTLDRNSYAEGMAWLYRPGCGGIDYFVYGDFKPGQSFKLSGAAPVVGRNCSIADNVYDNAEANLIFTPVSGGQPSTPPRQDAGSFVGGERMCARGVAEGSWLNVRVGPGADYAQIGQLSRQECNITILHECAGEWCPILGPGETLGWVSNRFLRPAH